MADERTEAQVLAEATRSGLGLTTSFVLSGAEPIRLVAHNEDGTWDSLCNTTDDGLFITTVHMAEMFEQYADELGELSALPPGHLAERQERGDAWVIEPE